MITQKVADTLMSYHYSDSNSRIQVLMIMEKATKVNPSIFEKHMDKLIGDKSVAPMEQHFVNNTIVNVAKEIKVGNLSFDPKNSQDIKKRQLAFIVSLLCYQNLINHTKVRRFYLGASYSPPLGVEFYCCIEYPLVAFDCYLLLGSSCCLFDIFPISILLVSLQMRQLSTRDKMVWICKQ